ncbi:hypothetical protein [Corynebacterium resistens]|uniref:hypothetical protein n=1 Tax=Corynebacterium resistens TaxID=258224 RepID=UPI0023564D64|nr:hypothetical protein [Corynebacterium resistens]
MKFRRTAATAVIAGLSAVSLNGVANAAPSAGTPTLEAPATDGKLTDAKPSNEENSENKGEADQSDKNKPATDKTTAKSELPNDPKEIVGSIADLLAFLPGLLPAGAEGADSAKSLDEAKLPQDFDELLGSASDLLSSGASGETEAPKDSATTGKPTAEAPSTGKPTDDAVTPEAKNTEAEGDKTEDAKAGDTGAASAGNTGNTGDAGNADKVTVPAADNKPVSADGKAAAERVIEEQEKKAGHDLVDVNFKDDKTAFISLAETFDQKADAEALKEIAQALHDNGFTVSAERNAK